MDIVCHVASDARRVTTWCAVAHLGMIVVISRDVHGACRRAERREFRGYDAA
jgi:hypothetical protein